MCFRVLKFTLIFQFFIIYFTSSSTDINLTEFQYIADHLSEKECLELVAALHFHNFDLPKDINAAERKIPEDISCLDLLLHWNSAYREGKGETHAEVCHRLNQIGREDLAQWLSKTVFHEISKDLRVALTASETDFTTLRPPNITERYSKDEIIDEAAWWQIDSLMEILIVFGLISLLAGSFILCFLCISRNTKTHGDYEKICEQEF